MKTKILLLLLLLSGCITKEDDFISKYCPGSCTVIQGRLTTDNGTQPLAGVRLNAYWRNYQTYPSIGYSERRKAVAMTDKNGNYELRFLLRDDELNGNGNDGIFVIPERQETFYISACNERMASIFDSYSHSLPRDTTLTLNYTLPSKAYVDIQPQNLQAMLQGDVLNVLVEITSGKDNSQTCATGAAFSPGAAAIYTIPVPANQPVTLKITKSKNGTVTQTNETVQLAPNEHFTYQPSF